MTWRLRRRKWDWHAFLSEDEEGEVRDLERRIVNARHEIATYTPPLNLIRNRAIQRAKYAAAKAPTQSGR